MTKLLRADFARIFKSRVFWLCAIFMCGQAVTAIYSQWREMKFYPDENITADGMLFSGPEFIGILIAVYLGNFIGADYWNGTIRNKLSIGHSRVSLYLSNLIVCGTASLILHFLWYVILFPGAAIVLPQPFEASAASIAGRIAVSVLAIVATTAVFLPVAMLITSKSAASVTVILLALAFLIAANTLQVRLAAPEYKAPYSYTVVDENGNTYEEVHEREKNPFYMNGPQRKVWEVVYDFLPTGQIMQLSRDSEEARLDDGVRLPLHAIGVTVVTTAAGIVLFRKKDLK